MRKLGLFWFAAALLGAALIFAGCETEAETETKYVSGAMIHLDTVVETIADLEKALAVEGDLAIGLSNSTTSFDVDADGLTIPADKVVYILNGTTLATASSATLTVAGIVYVGINGTLDVKAASSKVVVNEGGAVSVLSEKTVAGITDVGPGTLVIASDTSVIGEEGAKVLGTDKVSISGKLAYIGPVADNDALTKVFGYVGKGGTLDLSGATVTGLTSLGKPSEISALASEKSLIATLTASADETATSLTIPAGLELTAKSGDTLATLTTLTVNGFLNAPAATFAALTTVTGTGSIEAGAVPSAKAVILIGSAIAGISLEGATITGAFTVPADKLRALSDAEISGAVTVDGELEISGTLTLKNAITISEDGSLSLTLSSTITLADAAAKITGGTAYEFTPESGATDGTLATGDSTAVVFTSSDINGFLGSATLTFGIADSTLTIKDATSISGVVLDVSTKGEIKVEEDIVLTLALAGTDGVLSGGIFTAAITAGGTAKTVVKANAAGLKVSTGAFADAAALGVAKVLTSGTDQGNGDLITTGGAAAASGTITGGSSGTTINKDDTFAVTGTAIGVTTA
jgi:hypothetical protein